MAEWLSKREARALFWIDRPREEFEAADGFDHEACQEAWEEFARELLEEGQISEALYRRWLGQAL